MKAQWSWRVVGLFLGVFLVAAAGWMVVPSVAEAASCEGAPAPCAEDPALDNCTQCHSMQIQAGNRNGTDRQVTVSSSSNRHILGPREFDWASTVAGMISKGGGGDAAKTAAYLITNYCVGCNGPIMSSAALSNVLANEATVSWTTSGNAFGDLPATSCVLYGTNASSLTGDTCNPADPSYDPNNANLVTTHSVTITGLQPLTKYYVVHRSTAGSETATYYAAASFTTPPGGGGEPPGALGTIVSLSVGNFNADMNLDLAVGVSGKNHVIAYLGNGSGGFTKEQTLANVGTTPAAIASGGVEGDFNEDGNDDLAVVNFGEASQNVSVFLGTTPLGFETTAVSTKALPDPPTGVAIGDFTSDGVLDLAVATVHTAAPAIGKVYIFPGVNNGSGQGTGHFGDAITTLDIEISTVQAPEITSMVPDTVDCTGLPVDVLITGSLLLAGSMTIELDDTLPLQIISESVDNTSVTVRIPNGVSPGMHSVIVNVGGLPPASATLTVQPRAMTIDAITPGAKTYGIDSSGQVSIYGSGFQVGATVTIGAVSGATVAGTSASVTTPFVWVNSGLIRIWMDNTALPAGSYDVIVQNTDACGGSATVVDGFIMTAPQPAVYSLSTSNATYGITSSRSITISGDNFVSGAVINVGGLVGTTVPGTTASETNPFVFVTKTTLRFWWDNTSVPPGVYSAEVTNPAVAGSLSGSLPNALTVNATQPSVASVDPAAVTYGVTTNQSVVISGSDFLLGATITVGGLTGTTVAGTSASASNPFVFVTSSQLRFYWPNTSLPPGSYDVVVTNPTASGGLSGSLAGGFVVQGAQPVVTSVSPTPVTYGITASSSITIFGSDFVVGATITVGSLSGQTVTGSTASATNPFVFVTKTQVKFWWPNTSLPPGTYTVQVTNPAASGGLVGTLAGAFTVTAPQPTLTNLSPDTITYGIANSASITVFGSNFIVGAQITIGSLSGTTVSGSIASATTPYVYVTSGQLRFWWPNTSLAPGVYAIQVTNPASAGGLSATLASAFTVVAPQPTVTSATPASVVYGVSSSTSVTVAGSNFINGATITVGSLSGATVSGSIASASKPFVYTTGSQLKFWWANQSLPVGSYAITVTNPASAGGLSTVLADAFVVAPAVPAVSSVTPSPVTYGSTSQQITISGANFLVGGTITVGSLSGTTVNGSSASATVPYVRLTNSTLRFWWPSTSLPVGTYDVVVTNPASAGGASSTLTGGFVVQ